MKVKERSKLTAYNGHFLMKQYDRELYWQAMGGPNSTRAYVRQNKTAANYRHYTFNENQTSVYMHNKFGHQYQQPTGFHPLPWTGQHIGSGPQAWLDWTQFGRNHRNPRETTNRALEEWGIKFVNIDSRIAPRVEDLIAHRHKTYLTNFPWIKDPITMTDGRGDADWQWRGSDEIDYEASRGKDHASFNHRVMANLEPAVSSSGPKPEIVSAAAAATTKAAPAAAAASKKADAPAAAAEKKPKAEKKEKKPKE